MFGVGTPDVNHALPAHNFAILTDLLYRCPDLHGDYLIVKYAVIEL